MLGLETTDLWITRVIALAMRHADAIKAMELEGHPTNKYIFLHFLGFFSLTYSYAPA